MSMEHFPQRLRAARLMRGWSLQELADRLGGALTKQALSRYEKGMMLPAPTKLQLLASALGQRLDYFERSPEVKLEQVAFRKLARLKGKPEQIIKLNTADYLERYLELESLLGQDTTWTPLRLPGHTFEQVEEAAQTLRQRWDLGEGPLASVVELLEDRGIKVLELVEDPDFSGLAGWLQGQTQPFLVLNGHTSIPTDRKRFTALHELGHLVLEVGELPERLVEQRCNQFAGAMLLPRQQLEQELGRFRHAIHLKELQLLKQQFGLSMQGILYRARELGILSEYHYRQELKNFQRLGYRKNEPAPLPPGERPSRFLQLLCKGLAEEQLTASKAAALYNRKLAEFLDEINTLS